MDVQLIEDGGRNLWNCVNCHLSEIGMKRRLVITEEEKKNFHKIMNPDSPFIDEPEEEMTFSKEHGKLVLDIVEAPRNVFTYTKRSNRTFREEKMKNQAEKEKSNVAVLKIIQLLDPTVYLEYPKSSCTLRDHLKAIMEVMKQDISMNPDEEERYKSALRVLSTGVAVDKDEETRFEEFDEECFVFFIFILFAYSTV